MKFLLLPIAFVDLIIFKLVSICFSLIMGIANTEIFSNLDIKEITYRMYVIVGVLMLFKVVISAIQYLVNPDTFADKENGLFGILQRTIITIGLLVLAPSVFDYAIEIQGMVVDRIPNIIFGDTFDTKDASKTGDTISFTVLSQFIRPASEVLPANGVVKTVTTALDYTAAIGSGNTSVGEKGEIHDLTSFILHITDGCPVLLPSLSCDYFYATPLATIVGTYLAFILVSMAIDVGIRAVKLQIIKIFAPIAISNYVFGKDKFKKFVKTAVQVYVDLFIRLAIIYFTLFLIKFIMTEISEGVSIKSTGNWLLDGGIKITIIIALIVFAKKAPKFITDLIGLEGADETIGQMFKRAGGMFGTALETGRAFYAARTNSRNEIMRKAGIDPKSQEWRNKSAAERRQKLKEAMNKYGKDRHARVLRSTGSAFGTGFKESVIKGQGFKDTMSSARHSAERSYALSQSLADNDVKRGAYRRELVNRRLGIDSNLDVMNAEITAATSSSDKSKAALDYGHSNRGAKFANLKFDDDFIKANGGLDKKYVVGLDQEGKKIYVSLGDMSISKGDNALSINTVENQLKATIEDKDGRLKNMGLFGQQIISAAEEALDDLQGLGDRFTVNTSRRDKAYKDSVGYKDNPRFDTVVQEALEANIIHSTDTQYGRMVWEQAKKEGILFEKTDGTWDIRPEKTGDWLALNKKMGQVAQRENIAAKGGEGAAATIKSIADKFDNKKS